MHICESTSWTPICPLIFLSIYALFNLGEKLCYAFSGFHWWWSTDLHRPSVCFKDYFQLIVCVSLSGALLTDCACFFFQPCCLIITVVIREVTDCSVINPPVSHEWWTHIAMSEVQLKALSFPLYHSLASVFIIWRPFVLSAFFSCFSLLIILFTCLTWHVVLVLAPSDADRKC